MFGFTFEFKQDQAVQSAAAAKRKKAIELGRSPHVVSLSRIRKVIAQAFQKREQDRLVGKVILWVDDRRESVSDEMEMFSSIAVMGLNASVNSSRVRVGKYSMGMPRRRAVSSE
jgi:hypothetical protein